MPSAYEEESGDDQKPGDIPLTQPERAPSEFSGRSDSERDELEEDENEDSEVTKELLVSICTKSVFTLTVALTFSHNFQRPSSDQNIAPSIRIPETQWQEMEIDVGAYRLLAAGCDLEVTLWQTRTASGNDQIVSPSIEIPVTHRQGTNTDVGAYRLLSVFVLLTVSDQIVSPAIEIPVTHWPQGIDTDVGAYRLRILSASCDLTCTPGD